MQLQVQRLRPTAKFPTRATEGSAGYDLYAALDEPISIPAGAIQRIPTGLAVAPNRTDVALLLMARSGLSTKPGITMANGVGLVDSDQLAAGVFVLPVDTKEGFDGFLPVGWQI